MPNSKPATRTNFACLAQHDEQLVRLGMLAERYFADDPNTTILKLRQLAELLAQLVASNVGLYASPEEAQYELIRRLQDQGILPREVAQLFGEVRRAGNAASHAVAGDHHSALATLKVTWQLGVWYHRTFRDPGFKSGPFVPPAPPTNESEDLRAKLAALRAALADHQAAHQEAMHHYELRSVMGRAAPFEQFEAVVATPLDDGQLHLLATDETEALPLLPLVRLGASPTSAENACYFYNKRVGPKVSFVSYHFEKEASLQDTFPEVIAALARLTSGSPGDIGPS